LTGLEGLSLQTALQICADRGLNPRILECQAKKRTENARDVRVVRAIIGEGGDCDLLVSRFQSEAAEENDARAF